jgi:hypothetical protein
MRNLFLLGPMTPEEDEARRQLVQDARLARALGELMEEMDEGEGGSGCSGPSLQADWVITGMGAVRISGFFFATFRASLPGR